MRTGVSHWVLAACLLSAGSCAQPRTAGAAPYDTAAAEETLAAGYSSMVERHLRSESAAAAALDGMGGFGAIDPAIGVARTDGRVVLSRSGSPIATFAAPADDDVAGWARLTVMVAQTVSERSPAMAGLDAEGIYKAVFDAALSKLDHFSRYAGAREAAEHRAARNGFGGIGVTFEPAEHGARVTGVQDHTPAALAGIRIGDLLTQIDGQSLDHLDRDSITARLRGVVGTDVSVTVATSGGPARQLALHRSLIVLQTVTSSVHDGFAEFRITSFNQSTAESLSLQLKAARDQLGAAAKGVVLDLRGNPGGLLDQAVEVADLFIADGPIVSTRGRHPQASQSYDAHPGDIGEDLPVVVLVDGRSASAAEIVTAALEDSGRAVVVGTNSYGKGTVQDVVPLPNDGEMTLTWSRFHTPSGYALHHLGVLPTICTADLSADPDALIARLMTVSAQAPLAAELAQWRVAQLDDSALRNALRATCPPSPHGSAEIDMAVAEHLLDNRAEYLKALALTAPPAAAPAGAATAGVAQLSQQVQH